MIRGSHNSWTYLKPVWFMRIFAWIGKCQKLSIREQIQEGIRIFDLRVDFSKNKVPYIRHGLMRYQSYLLTVTSELEDINYFSTKRYPMYVRVMYEDLHHSERHRQYDVYRQFCQDIEKEYPEIHFFGGNSRKQWNTKFYVFKCREPEYTEMHGSVSSNRWYDKLVPWFYANRMNVINRDQYSDKNLMQDFIEI